jgi:TM2 domain-containing membrane protein YozV
MDTPPSPPPLPVAPPPVIAATPSNANDLLRFENEKKSAALAFILCWFLGIWGAHRFYLGKPYAWLKVIITLVSIPLCFFFIGFFGLFAMWLWMIIDLFYVSRWVRAHNTALLERISAGKWEKKFRPPSWPVTVFSQSP